METVPIGNCGISDLGIWQDNIPSGTGTGIGLDLYYTAVFQAEHLQISGFIVGVRQQRATNTNLWDVESSFATSASVAPSGFIGFQWNGNAATVAATTLTQAVSASPSFQTVSVASTAGITVGSYAVVGGTETVEILAVPAGKVVAVFLQNHPLSPATALDVGAKKDIGGNASSIYRDCSVSAYENSYTNLSHGSIAFQATGSYVGDILIDNFNSSYTYYGIYIDFTTAAPNTGGTEDILILNPVLDEYTYQGILLNGPASDTNAMVTIVGGWLDPYPGTSPNGLYLSGMSGVTMIGTQFMANTSVAAFQEAVYAAVASSATPSDIIIQGCQFIGQKVGFIGTATNVQIIGNRFYNPQTSATVMVNCVACTNVGVLGNIFQGITTLGYALQFDSSTTLSVASGNTFNVSAGTAVSNPGTNTNMFVANAGYNPLGGAVPQPAAPTSSPYSYTNTTGVYNNVSVSGGTGVSAITVDGKSMGVNTGVFRVPPGKVLTFTYASAPTLSAVGD